MKLNYKKCFTLFKFDGDCFLFSIVNLKPQKVLK